MIEFSDAEIISQVCPPIATVLPIDENPLPVITKLEYPVQGIFSARLSIETMLVTWRNICDHRSFIRESKSLPQ